MLHRKEMLQNMTDVQNKITKKDVLLNLAGSLILAFGLYNIHALSGVTEGGVLGLSLLLRHWLGISPAVSGLVLSCLCYFLGIRVLGKRFLLCSAIAICSYSGFYAVFEQFSPVYPEIGQYPLAAALIGAVFVGVGVGLCVRGGGAPTGDDALAMSLSRSLRCGIQWIYLGSDLLVLLASLSYLPFDRILYSLLSVILSGQVVGLVERAGKPKTRLSQ